MSSSFDVLFMHLDVIFGLWPIVHRNLFSWRWVFWLSFSGLDNAGKTTILKKFNGEDINTISPTLGFNIKTLEHNGYNLNIWDVGGQKSLRSYWRNYFETTDGLIWVVDSADRRRLDDCKKELHQLLQEEVQHFHHDWQIDAHLCHHLFQRLLGATLLVFANKQDLPGALTAEEIKEVSEILLGHVWNLIYSSSFAHSFQHLELESIKTHHWRIVWCSAVTGENLLQGVDWILEDISARIFTLD